jgi:hypothetical protein
MKRSIVVLVLAALMLAGCVSDFLSPSTTTIDSHDRTWETSQAQTAELSQDNNKSICVGLVNIGSCNTTQVNSQRAVPPPVPPAANDSGDWLSELCIGMLVIFVGFGSTMVLVALFGPRGYDTN